MEMDLGSPLPFWLTPVAWIYLVSCVISAGVLVYAVYGRGQRPKNRSMAPIWPISALFLGPIVLLMYARWGKGYRQSGVTETPESVSPGTESLKTGPLIVLLPGAAASTLAHLVGVPVVFGAGWTIAALVLLISFEVKDGRIDE